MSILVIFLVSLLAAGLTFFSGFGLGTLLLPAFAFFFPIEVAIAMTAIVHLANNAFKGILVWRHTDWKLVLEFGLPATLMSFLGAALILRLADWPPLYSYSWGDHHYEVMPIKLAIAVLLALFALQEALPSWKSLSFDRRWIPLGGVLSGFFGGLSGMQGALRSSFLIRAGLEKEAFVATGIMAAIFVDIARIAVYGMTFFDKGTSVFTDPMARSLLLVGIIAAFAGSLAGNFLLSKVTLEAVQRTVAAMLMAIALAMALGWV